jgi:hypothetical protein
LPAGGSAVGSGVSDSLGLRVSDGGADVVAAAEVGAAVVGAAVVGVGVRVAGGVVGGLVVGATLRVGDGLWLGVWDGVFDGVGPATTIFPAMVWPWTVQ